ncbi:hypothetical protein K474DRAFT_1671963 [Panus rudis PR-1116 ss-1]|nr:hypothetical protein K474DRAFT_1671963 [Panus rudis PR-1116 ss-1]
MYSLTLPKPFLNRWTSSNTEGTSSTTRPSSRKGTSSSMGSNSTNDSVRRPKSKPRHHPHLRITSSRKASPTLSLTNASAVGTGTSACSGSCSVSLLPSPEGLPEVSRPATRSRTNSIPFPSSPTPTPSMSCNTSSAHEYDPFEHDVDLLSYVVVEPNRLRPRVQDDDEDMSPVVDRPATAVPVPQAELRRRKGVSDLSSPCSAPFPSSPLSTSCLDDDTTPMSCPEPEFAYPSPSPSPKRQRVSSTNSKLNKRARKARKQTADMQFVALMHRSIANHLRELHAELLRLEMEEEAKRQSGANGNVDVDVVLEEEEDNEDDAEDCDYVRIHLEQDLLLVERLWQNLVDQGFRPILLEDVPPSTNVATPVPLSSPFYDSKDEHATGLLTPPPSPTLSPRDNGAGSGSNDDIVMSDASSLSPQGTPSPPSLHIPQLRIPSLIPVSSPVNGPQTTPEILTLPQLVASLIFRANERHSTKPRRARRHGNGKKIVGGVGVAGAGVGTNTGKGRSPLSQVVAVSEGEAD